MWLRASLAVLTAVGVTAAYLLTWPVPIQAVAWTATVAPGYQGAHAVNTRLQGLQHLSLGDEVGPEHVVAAPEGGVYTTVASGKLLWLSADGQQRRVVADTQGRVLGFDLDRQGQLIAADALRGLLRVTPEGGVMLLVDAVDGDPIRYANSVVVTRQAQQPERFYFSDASARFAPREWGGTFEASVLDILEQSATGRVLVHDPATGRTEVVARGLSFANGVALSADESTLYVAETGRYRVWAIPASARGLDLSQGPSGGAQVLLDNLPGYPDNLMRGLDGRIWMGFAKPRNPVIDGMATKPWLRELTLRLPRAWWPIPKAYGHVVAFNEQGQVVADLQDPAGNYPETTAITETPDRLYVQSLHAHSLGWLPRTVLTAP